MNKLIGNNDKLIFKYVSRRKEKERNRYVPMAEYEKIKLPGLGGSFLSKHRCIKKRGKTNKRRKINRSKLTS
jgi:hypothetical protein